MMAVQALLSRKPRSLGEWLVDHAAHFA